MCEKKNGVGMVGLLPNCVTIQWKLYCDTAGLRGLNGCGFLLQYNNYIVTRAAGGLGEDCIAIHSSVL